MLSATGNPRTAANIGKFLSLLTKYVLPFWKALLLLVGGSSVAALLLALLPFIIAAILDVALGRPIGGEESVGLGNLSLSNLGAALFQWLGIDSVASPRTAVTILSGIFLALGVLYAATIFANYMVALRIRVLAARNLPGFFL